MEDILRNDKNSLALIIQKISESKIDLELAMHTIISFCKENSLEILVSYPDSSNKSPKVLDLENMQTIKNLIRFAPAKLELKDPYKEKIFIPRLPEVLKPEIIRKFGALAVTCFLGLNTLGLGIYKFQKCHFRSIQSQILKLVN